MMAGVVFGCVMYLLVTWVVALGLARDSQRPSSTCTALAVCWPALFLMVCVYAFFSGVEAIFEERP